MIKKVCQSDRSYIPVTVIVIEYQEQQNSRFEIISSQRKRGEWVQRNRILRNNVLNAFSTLSDKTC